MNKIVKLAFVMGSVGGALYIILLSVLYGVYQNPFVSAPKSFDFFIYIFVIVGALYWFRFRMNAGLMHFWQGCLLGLFTILTTLLISIIFIVFLINNQPTIIQTYKKDKIQAFLHDKPAYLQAMQLDSMTQKERMFGKILQDLKKVDDKAWFWHLLQKETLEKIFLGLFLSFVVAALFRK